MLLKKLRNSSVKKRGKVANVDMKKKILQTVLFLGIMFLTFYTLLHGQNLSEIYQAVKNMSVPYLIAAAGLALFLSAQRAA